MIHKHHIIPKHIGGAKGPTKEVTIEEHAEIHRLMWKTEGRWQDYLAWKGLSGCIGKEEFIRIKCSLGGQTNKGKLKPKTSETLIQKYANGWTAAKGKTQSEESNEKRRKWNIEHRWRPADGVGRKFEKGNTVPWKGKKRDPEIGRKISETKRQRRASGYYQ